ncbi:MAG: CoA-acylating methylmalonate-semialdehyde dehydrogenase [Bacillota bacterium]|nr:CoA-acylating methylmalonate-semialdehyde dehydrogenase [Bacillota bacterium]
MGSCRIAVEAGAERLRNYVGGKWVESRSSVWEEVRNPATDEVLALVPFSTKEEVDECVASAKRAFPEWRATPAVERCRYLFRLKHLLEEKQAELARVITLEHGKEYRAAYGEMRRLIEMVEVACGIPTLMMGDYSEQIAPRIEEYSIRVPLGVFAMIPPFNFPGMVPFWFMPWAVALGDTYIIKPNRQCPITQQRLFELIEEVGFPPGVVNLVNGGREVNSCLIEHPDVKGVSFVGSTEGAKAIYRMCAEHGKRCQAQGGANNFLVVMPDADLDTIIPNIMESCFGNSGQRCLSGGVVVGVGPVYERLKEKFLEAASNLKVGCGLDEDTDLAPVVSREALHKLHEAIDRGIREGAKLLLDGRGVKVPGYPNGYFLGPTVFEAEPGMHVFDEEIFGPVRCLKRVETLDEAIELINSSRYGNAATIYTQSGAWAREFRFRVECGNVGVNVGVVAPMAFYPFAGMKDSFFGDLHGQGKDVLDFFADRKVVIERWFPEREVRERWF